MATSTRPITASEFADMPDPSGGFYHELHHGQVVTLTRPKRPHLVAQDNLIDLLKPLAQGRGRVIMEMPFCPLDTKQRSIRVHTPDGNTVKYGERDQIPVPLLGGESLAVSAVFDEG